MPCSYRERTRKEKKTVSHTLIHFLDLIPSPAPHYHCLKAIIHMAPLSLTLSLPLSIFFSSFLSILLGRQPFVAEDEVYSLVLFLERSSLRRWLCVREQATYKNLPLNDVFGRLCKL